MWQLAHTPAALPWFMGNQVWLKTACSHEVSENLWQVSQVVGKPAAMWFTGEVAVW